MQDALDYGSSQLGFAIRVYRYGCLVGEDRLAAGNDDVKYESWSLGKSVTSMLFGRAMTERAGGVPSRERFRFKNAAERPRKGF